MTTKTNGPSMTTPDMTDEDWRAFAAACSQPTPSDGGPESLASKAKTPTSKDERWAQAVPRDNVDTSHELEDFSRMSADAIVARQRAVGAVPTTSVPLAPAPVEEVSPELLEIRSLRHELHDLTSLVLSMSKRIGASSGRGK
ncbi:MAG: hypothetical protein ABSF69_26985 [Polyangiaceae bacterium]|jgi:hypothetical protein